MVVSTRTELSLAEDLSSGCTNGLFPLPDSESDSDSDKDSYTIQILLERDLNLNLSQWKHVLHNTM